MCKYCDEKGYPCLMCGRACMEYQLDRSRCGGCRRDKRPPKEFPPFRFCPYCGCDLDKAVSSDTDVSKQIFANIEENSQLLFDGVRNIVVMTETDFEALKTKYTEGQE